MGRRDSRRVSIVTAEDRRVSGNTLLKNSLCRLIEERNSIPHFQRTRCSFSHLASQEDSEWLQSRLSFKVGLY